MEYFISAEAKSYDDWQLELVIESFKKLKYDDQLLIGLAETNKPRYIEVKNIDNHPRSFIHANLGQKKGMPELNEIYSLIWALDNKRIKMPLCIMKPHFAIRYKNIEIFPDQYSRGVVFAPDPFFTFDQAEKMAGPFWERLKNPKEYYQEFWIYLGNLMFLRDLPLSLIAQVSKTAEELIMFQYEQRKPAWHETLKLSWVVNFADNIKEIFLQANANLTSTMIDNLDTPFIDYEHGLPPMFSRSMFTFPEPQYISFGDPLEVISGLNQTLNAHFMSSLANSIIDKRIVRSSPMMT